MMFPYQGRIGLFARAGLIDPIQGLLFSLLHIICEMYTTKTDQNYGFQNNRPEYHVFVYSM